jgi:hypothetical protein
VRVALGHHLADQHRIGALRGGRGHQAGHLDLSAQVDHPDLPVVLQAFLPRVPLDVQDRVDAHGVRVGADAGADHDQLAAERGADAPADLGRGQQRVLPLGHGDLGQVDQVADPAVDDEEREVRSHALGVHDHGRVQPHLGRQLERGAIGQGALGRAPVRHRQRERHLHPAVPGGVAVGADNAHGWSRSRRSAAGLK